MPRSAKEMIKFLKKNGFVILRQNGSHVQMRNYVTGRQTTVPNHGSKSLDKGLEHEILKQAGLL